MNYYISGPPYPSELYHFGILGQKWGVRRYQNPDGTLTTLGKMRYGAGKVGETALKVGKATAKATGRAVSSVAKHRVDKFKSKHPWLMSDDELRERTDRIKRENAYRDELRKNRTPISKGKRVVQEILESGAKSVATAGFNKLAKNAFEKEKPVRSLEKILKKKNATMSEIDNAAKREKYLNEVEKNKNSKALDESKYDVNNLPNADKMTKRELDQYNAWLKSRQGIENQLKGMKFERTSEDNAARTARAQQAHAQVENMRESAERNRNSRQDRLNEIRRTAERNASYRLTSERRREVEQVVDNIFRQAAINNADRPDSLTSFRRTAEYNAARRRALQLAEEGSRITVNDIFSDLNIDG